MYYPTFDTWYHRSIIPGFARGSRDILIVKETSFPENIAGIAILKTAEKPFKNNKICSLYITPLARGHGTGAKLIAESLAILQQRSRSPRVIITVPEEGLRYFSHEPQFERFLEDRGFLLKERVLGRYRPCKVEFIYQLDLHSLDLKEYECTIGFPAGISQFKYAEGLDLYLPMFLASDPKLEDGRDVICISPWRNIMGSNHASTS